MRLHNDSPRVGERGGGILLSTAFFLFGIWPSTKVGMSARSQDDKALGRNSQNTSITWPGDYTAISELHITVIKETRPKA